MTTVDLTPMGDQLVDPADLPWVPQAEGVWFKPLRLSPVSGTWTNLLKVTRRGVISRHRHPFPVEAWVLQGSWRYLEHDWTAGPGSYVYEPAGDVHTLVTEGEDEMVTLFSMHGRIDYLNDAGEVTFTETAQTKLDKYLDYCARHRIAPLPVVA
ncbi:quercetin dioxygenase-like cupin family protein [Nonomuraea thailandensis]|uniref:Quercetin dioxygenase-like cupin family protein n=1 Tax=Nonomuraea thailandensis TaxID=1188745 RepID=A0A9X2G9Q8_9ACTN|nr:2,4'-dihydroxyacetophenone dioxygenase family protein [Nonomuraea thailandensis]MCP2353637.1 quercetin dioxygenase-like cupin family protein [Nonomuraea thailandensis]